MLQEFRWATATIARLSTRHNLQKIVLCVCEFDPSAGFDQRLVEQCKFECNRPACARSPGKDKRFLRKSMSQIVEAYRRMKRDLSTSAFGSSNCEHAAVEHILPEDPGKTFSHDHGDAIDFEAQGACSEKTRTRKFARDTTTSPFFNESPFGSNRKVSVLPGDEGQEHPWVTSVRYLSPAMISSVFMSDLSRNSTGPAECFHCQILPFMYSRGSASRPAIPLAAALAGLIRWTMPPLPMRP